MLVTFVRTAGSPDRVYVRRTGGGEVSWSFPTYGNAPPHDLVHLVVETAFGVARGFWGRVDAGIDPSRVNARANRTVGALDDKYRGFGDDLGELIFAETLANLHWGVPDFDDAARLATLERGCAELGRPVPDGAAPLLVRVREVLEGLGDRWRALVPKGAIEVGFDPADLRRSFEEISAASR